MTAARIDVAIAALVVVLTATAVARMRTPIVATAAPHAALQATTPLAPPRDPFALERAAQATADANPFRLSRLPSDVPYSRITLSAPPAPPPAPRPTLVLKGIVGGPPWQAVIDGLPGAPPGSVVREGGVFGKLTIRSVTRDTVVIQAPDTVWHLTLSRGTP